MTRIVVDSNVYISALVFGGVPQRILDLIHSQGLSLYISPSIMDEVAGTLSGKFNWTRKDIAMFLPPLWERCIMTRPTIRLKICPDPDDNHVLECAQAAQADFLITGTPNIFPNPTGRPKLLVPANSWNCSCPKQGNHSHPLPKPG